MEKPKTAKGVLIVVAFAAFLVVAYFASTWGGIAVLAILIAIGTYAVYVSGVRFHRWVLGG